MRSPAQAAVGDRPAALFYRGHANFNLGNFAQAAEDFDASLQGRTTLKTRLPSMLWRYASQVPRRRMRARV